MCWEYSPAIRHAEHDQPVLPALIRLGKFRYTAHPAALHCPRTADKPGNETPRRMTGDFPYYPINEFGPAMKGMAIGGLGIVHVFLAQFGIGGGLLLCYFQWLAQTGSEPSPGRFIDGYFKFVVLVSFVLGAITGVGMWFTDDPGQRTDDRRDGRRVPLDLGDRVAVLLPRNRRRLLLLPLRAATR